MLKIVVTPTGSSAINRQLARLTDRIQDHQRLARKAGGQVAKYSKARVRKQQALTGGPFAPRKASERKKTSAKRRMLLKLGKTLSVASRAYQGGGIAVTWKNRVVATTAYRHQHGLGEDWNPAKARKVYGVPDYQSPCTQRQARALLKEGYRLTVPAKGGGRRLKRVSAGWLQKNMPLGQAGLILRMMRTGKARGKQYWQDTPPGRPFLGVTGAEAEAITTDMAKAITKNL